MRVGALHCVDIVLGAAGLLWSSRVSSWSSKRAVTDRVAVGSQIELRLPVLFLTDIALVERTRASLCVSVAEGARARHVP